MAVIEAVWTDLGRDLLAQHIVGDIPSVQINYFELGEGGFAESGGVKTPKVPNSSLTRLEASGAALTGQVTFTNASANVSGTGSQFTAEVTAGQFVRLDQDAVWVEVQSVTDDNNLVLTAPYTGAGGGPLPGSVSGSGLYVFRKSFAGIELTFEEDGRSNAVAFLDFGEGNDDGFGSNPEFFELGLFDSSGNMLAYGTFPGETKTALVQFNKVARVQFLGL